MLGMSNYVHTTKIKDDMIGYKERRETWKEVLYHIAHNVVLFLMFWMQHKVPLLYFSEISQPNKYQKIFNLYNTRKSTEIALIIRFCRLKYHKENDILRI